MIFYSILFYSTVVRADLVPQHHLLAGLLVVHRLGGEAQHVHLHHQGLLSTVLKFGIKFEV
jgi:hypothetical protein